VQDPVARALDRFEGDLGILRARVAELEGLVAAQRKALDEREIAPLRVYANDRV
jgi:hypothetical protein